MDPRIPTPTDVMPQSDPGDDTARRYRYQWTYAGIVCCMILDDTEDAQEVFCEHHEDILVKHNDNSFTGIQVKTRASDQPVWKTTDDDVIRACQRFVKLEVDFPGQFRAFLFRTNHPLHSAKNGQDLCHVLESVKKAAAKADLPNYILRFISKIARLVGCSDEVAFTALSKADARSDLPKLADIEMRLVDALTSVWPHASDGSYTSVRRAGRALVEECGRASSLAHEETLPAYLSVMSRPTSVELTARLAGKRIDSVRLNSILDQGFNEKASLVGQPELLTEPGVGTTDLLCKKLDAGGFSAVSVNSAKDLRDKADYLGLVWTKKFGRKKGLERYGHVRSLILRDGADAYENTKHMGDPFGLKMRAELRHSFRERRSDGSELFDASDEHLEGFSYSLTSECKLYWSTARPWET